MSQPPPPYERSFSFTDHSINTPQIQQPGQKIDQELNNILTSLEATQSRLAELQADDGMLRDSVVDASAILGPATASSIASVNAAGATQLALMTVSKDQAAASATAAAASATYANQQSLSAQAAKNDAYTSATQAEASKNSVIVIESNVLTSSNAAITAANAAVTTANAAVATATTQANNATSQANAAASQASNASNSATAAATSASQALTSANNSAASAASSQSFTSQAQSSASQAASSASSSQAFATAAGNSATTSSTNATAAGTSATAAAGSATSAANSATAASGSATAAAGSATAAATSATAASSSATSASGSATAAAGSASAAALSAIDAQDAADSILDVTYTAPLQKVGNEVSINADPVFSSVSATTGGSQFTFLSMDGLYFDNSSAVIQNVASITFADATVQTTAYTGQNIFDQSLNTTDSPTFQTVTAEAGLNVGGLGTAGITFADTTVQTTAGIGRVVEVNDTQAGLRITQTGTGNAFLVEDSSPDGNPFVINNAGSVGIGVALPSAHLDVNSGISTRRNLLCSHSSSVYIANNVEFNENGSGVNLLVTSGATATGDAVRITNLGSGNSFVVEDSTNPDSTPFVIDQFGSVIVGKTTATAGVKLDVAGNATFNNNNGVVIAVGVNQVPTTINNNGTGNSFVVNDQSGGDPSPFIIDNAGNVTVGGTLTIGTSTALTGVATDAEAQEVVYANQSDTKAMSVKKTTDWSRRHFGLKRQYGVQTGLSVQSTGTNASFSQVATYANVVCPSASVAGFTRGYVIAPNPLPWVSSFINYFNYYGSMTIGVNLAHSAGRVGTRVMCLMGAANSQTAGVVLPDPTSKTVGWSWYAGENINLVVHDGTTLYFVDSGYAPPFDGATRPHNISVEWDGSGNASLYILTDTGTEHTCSSANAPTGNAASATSTSFLLQFSTDGTQTLGSYNLNITYPQFSF